MAVPLPAQLGRASRLLASTACSALYGRALHLPPPALPRRPYPGGHAVVEGLRPFRQRLHLQRAAVMLLRALALAALTAAIIFLLRVFGVAVALPLAPLAGAGVAFFVVLLPAPWQRPATLQMAHALDERLRMREQIGSALDVAPTDGRVAAFLYERAGAALRETHPARVLPWPSLRRERTSLIALGAVVAISGLLAYHAAPIRHLALRAAAPAAQVAAARRAANHRAALPARLVALGTTAKARLLGASLAGHSVGGTRAAQNGPRASRGQGRALPANALTLHTTQGRAGSPGGSGTRTGNTASNQNNGASRGANGAGAASSLHLTPSRNSPAGGVASPEQQALTDLQNSISSAQGQGSQQAMPNAGRNNGNAPSGSMGQLSQQAPGHNGRGNGQAGAPTGRTTGHGRSGAAGSSAQPGAAGRGPRGSSRRLGPEGDPSLMDRSGHQGGGTGPQSTSPGLGTDNLPSSARLSNGNSVTLNGAPGSGGRLILSVGAPNRAPGPTGGSLAPGSANTIVTVPGYVAPDSNSVAPDDRAVIQQYFSPPAGSQ